MSATPPLWMLAIASLAASFLLSLGWRAFALRRGHVDQPGHRRLHQVPTPRGGGIGIALVLLVASAWLGEGRAAFALGLALCAGAGLLDDLRPLPPALKLALQAAGALCLAWAFPLYPAVLGQPLGVAAAACFVVGLVNVWNFLDGSNGMAATQALLSALGLALLAPAAPGLAWLAVALSAACLGFLPLNFPRARLFLGDVGSHALGYAVAALGLLAASRMDAAQGWLLLLPPSVMLIDAGLTLVARARRRQVLWQAHREHLYQRAVARGWSHAGVCALYAAWTVAACALALAVAGQAPPWPLAACALAYVAGTILHAALGRRWPRPGVSLEPAA